MFRSLFAILAGALAGACLAGLLVFATSQALAWYTSPRRFEIEHGVIYLAVVLGAGFGAVCGILGRLVPADSDQRSAR